MTRASTAEALFALFFSHRRYVEIGVQEIIASGLSDPIVEKMHRDGTWPGADHLTEYHEQVSSNGAALRRFVATAFAWSMTVLVVSLGVAFVFGVAHPSLSWKPEKVLAVAGGFLAAWGTIFQLGRTPGTWGGNSLAERLPAPIFLVLFVPGSVLAALGALW